MNNNGPIKILISSLDAYGHVNACLGLGAILAKRGNEVYFLNRSIYKESIEKHGMKFLATEDYQEDGVLQKGEGNVLAETFGKFDMKLEQSTTDRQKSTTKEDVAMLFSLFEEIKKGLKVVEKVIQQMNFDIVLGDFLFTVPFIMQCPVPYVPIRSTNPVGLYNGPPECSGLSVHDDPKKWEEFREASKETLGVIGSHLKPWFQEAGLEVPEAEELGTYAKYLGVYVYPEALDYKELGSPKENWIRLDGSIRKPTNKEFKIPETLAGKPGKLIFFSMGSLGSSNLNLMNRVLNVLSKSPHRFIVSKGARGDEIDLSDNMWGQNFVDQLAILPKVDLVITHGGNNTVVETLAAGKPMIVMPMFADQSDNAQRIEDLGLGRRIEPFRCNDDDILQAIEDLLADESVKEKVAQMSRQLHNSNSGDKVAEYIEKLARTRESPFNDN